MIPGTTIMKASTNITCFAPNAHEDQFVLEFGYIHMEGGAKITVFNLFLKANDLILDDGAWISADNGGHSPESGRGAGVAHSQNYGGTGASHGGTGGKGQCNAFHTCRMNRAEPYGNMYEPEEYGSGGGGQNGGIGKFMYQ